VFLAGAASLFFFTITYRQASAQTATPTPLSVTFDARQRVHLIVNRLRSLVIPVSGTRLPIRINAVVLTPPVPNPSGTHSRYNRNSSLIFSFYSGQYVLFFVTLVNREIV
jgi:hypothetical protein